MRLVFYLGVAIIVVGVWAVIWWYYPWVRRPWWPTRKPYRRAKELCRRQGVGFPPPSLRVVVLKKVRRLDLISGERLIASYRIGLGTNPTDDKRREGDGCTPEGDFYVCTKNDRSRYHLFIGISYPNAEDAGRGLRAGLVSGEQHREILEALAGARRPPWDTPLGGEIGLHGGGAGSDWTAGCVALDNDAIEEFFVMLDLGDRVEIRP